MIGFIAGLGLLFSYLGAAWTVDTTEGSLFSAGLGGAFAILGVLTIVGIFLFPRTVGMAFTPMSFATPIAFLIALFRQGRLKLLGIFSALSITMGKGSALVAL